jgi:hypothetical protein
MMAVSSASVAGFLITRGGRDAEPTTIYIQSNVSSSIEDVTGPIPATAGSEPVAELLIPNDRVGNTAPSDVPESSPPAEPDSALSSPAQKVEERVQSAVFAGQPEAEASQGSELGQPDEIARLIEQLDHQAAETPDPTHDPIPLIVQSPAIAPAGSAETTPHSDAAQSDADNPLDVTHREPAQAAAAVPTENVSAALH